MKKFYMTSILSVLASITAHAAMVTGKFYPENATQEGCGILLETRNAQPVLIYINPLDKNKTCSVNGATLVNFIPIDDGVDNREYYLDRPGKKTVWINFFDNGDFELTYRDEPAIIYLHESKPE